MDLSVIFPRHMSRKRTADAASPSRIRVLIAIVAIAGAGIFATFLGGCEELDARREIKAGNKLYEKGEYTKAAEAFERGVAKKPGLDIGQHNLGLAYYKMFQTASETDRAKQYADKAAEHLGL